MRVYETMIIFEPEFGDDDVRAQVGRIEKLLQERGAVVRSVDYWGLRKFAYEINHKREGHYVVLVADAEPDAVDEMGRVLRLADEVIRYKTMRLPEHVKRPLGQESSAS